MIHKYNMNGLNIVLDVNSGAVHVLDKPAFEIVDYMDLDLAELKLRFAEIAENDIEEAYSELSELIDQGLLYSHDIDREAVGNLKRETVVKALCLHIAHDCNMSCSYCFAGEGEYNGKRSLMSLETGKAAIDFIIKNSGNRKNLEIDFFGGEPLMNFETVKGIVEYGRSLEKANNKKFRFTLTTNGLLLNEETESYINENMDNVVLSIDGRREINDKMRKCLSGAGSYDITVPKYQRFVEKRGNKNHYIRGTYTHENLDFSNDVLHLAELGFKQISVEPVVADKDRSFAITEADLPKLFDEYEKLALEILERKEHGGDFNFFHFNIDLEGGPCVVKRISGCGAGTEYLAVTPEGELYPCHQFVGLPEYRLGCLQTGVTNNEKREMFGKCNVYAKTECTGCWCKFYCSGGCAANAYETHGDILTPYGIGCELQKKRTECAIMIKASEFLGSRRPEIVNRGEYNA